MTFVMFVKYYYSVSQYILLISSTIYNRRLNLLCLYRMNKNYLKNICQLIQIGNNYSTDAIIIDIFLITL